MIVGSNILRVTFGYFDVKFIIFLYVHILKKRRNKELLFLLTTYITILLPTLQEKI